MTDKWLAKVHALVGRAGSLARRLVPARGWFSRFRADGPLCQLSYVSVSAMISRKRREARVTPSFSFFQNSVSKEQRDAEASH
jgi:hypothetical protein